MLRVASVVVVGCALLLSACSSVDSPTQATASSPLPVIAISSFAVSAETAGTGLSYRTSYQVAETSGRANALINTVTFAFGSGSFVTNANPSSPARLPAGTTLLSGVLNISDSAGLTTGATSVTLTIGWVDEIGRGGTIASTATITR